MCRSMGFQHFPIHRNTHTHTQHLEYIWNRIHTWLRQSRPDSIAYHHLSYYVGPHSHTRTLAQLHKFSHSQASINSMASYIREMLRHLNERMAHTNTCTIKAMMNKNKQQCHHHVYQTKKHGLDVSYIYKFCAAIFLAVFFPDAFFYVSIVLLYPLFETKSKKNELFNAFGWAGDFFKLFVTDTIAIFSFSKNYATFGN